MRMITDTAIPSVILPDGVIIEQFKDVAPDGETVVSGEYYLPKGCAGPHSAPSVILYLHGGAFCVCNPTTHRLLLAHIVLVTGCAIFALDYRRPPEDPFPAPLDDAIACYEWLHQKRHFTSDNIFLGGDSAGGGLSVAVAVELQKRDLPPPRGLVLMSPWVDLSDTTRHSWTRNAAIDFLPTDLAELFAKMYAGKRELQDPEISPLYADHTGLPLRPQPSSSSSTLTLTTYWPTETPIDPNTQFGGLPPTLVEAGMGECLIDQITDLVHRMRMAGVDVSFDPAKEMIHVFQLFTYANDEQTYQPMESLERIGKFVKSLILEPMAKRLARGDVTVTKKEEEAFCAELQRKRELISPRGISGMPKHSYGVKMKWIDPDPGWIKDDDEHRSAGIASNLLKEGEGVWDVGEKAKGSQWVIFDLKQAYELKCLEMETLSGDTAPQECELFCEKDDGLWSLVTHWIGDQQLPLELVDFAPMTAVRWKLVINTTYGKGAVVQHVKLYGCIAQDVAKEELLEFLELPKMQRTSSILTKSSDRAPGVPKLISSDVGEQVASDELGEKEGSNETKSNVNHVVSESAVDPADAAGSLGSAS